MATLKLYQTEIENKRNMIVEFIQDYLDGLAAENKAEVINFQRQKIELNLKLKIRMDQSFVDKPIFNYLSVQNDANGRVFYYFIDKIVWVSYDAVGLECTLDTLNTFDRSLGEDNWEDLLSPRTHVTREHKDRFYDNPVGNTYARKIDRYAEEFHPILYRTSKRDIKSTLTKKGYNEGFWLVLSQSGTEQAAKSVESIYCNTTEAGATFPLSNYNPDLATEPSATVDMQYLQKPTINSAKVNSVIYCPYFPGTIKTVVINSKTYYYSTDVGVSTAHSTDLSDGDSGIYASGEVGTPAENTQLEKIHLPLSAIITNKDKDLNWSIYNESKLFNSQFYKVKMVFAESYLNILCENFDFKDNSKRLVDMYPSFLPSVEADSTMMFKFDLDPDVTYHSTAAYQLIMISNRNLEHQQLTGAYNEYLKHGSKYDKANFAIGVVNSGVSFIGSTAKAVATGDVLGGVSSTIGTATSIISRTLALEQKQEDLMNQQVGVSGVSDLSMFMATNPYLSWMTFEPRDDIKQMIADYFNRFGYITDEYKVPDFHSRCWRNFVQCDPTFYTNRLNFDAEFLDDIKIRLKEGVCFYHQVVINNKKKYDFDEVKENWEEFLVR